MKSKNKLIQVLMDFGKEIKRNGIKTEVGKHMKSYVWMDGKFDYDFTIYKLNGKRFYSIMVCFNQTDHSMVPLMKLEFSENSVVRFLDNKDLVVQVCSEDFVKGIGIVSGDLE